MTDNLTWDRQVQKIIIPQLENIVRTFRLVIKYLGRGVTAIYSNATFRSKMNFGIETLRGEPEEKH